MATIKTIDSYDRSCPVRNILSKIGDKWFILTLLTIHKNKTPIRFMELQRAIPDISQKVLTSTLQSLEEDGFILRKAYPEVPPRVEYSITERSQSLLPHIFNLVNWAKDNMEDIINDRLNYSKKKRTH